MSWYCESLKCEARSLAKNLNQFARGLEYCCPDQGPGPCPPPHRGHEQCHGGGDPCRGSESCYREDYGYQDAPPVRARAEYVHKEKPPCPDPSKMCSNQVIVEGKLTIPTQKPDIEKVLRFTPTCEITNWQVICPPGGQKVVVSGFIHIAVEYVADLPDQPMHFAHFTEPFHTFFLCPFAVAEVRCRVEFEHWEIYDKRNISNMVIVQAWGVDP